MDDNDYVLTFDHFYTNNHIQILKSLLPFIEGENSAMLPVLIKYMELKYTISLAGKRGSKIHGSGIFACNAKKGSDDNIEQIYNAIRRYLAPDEDKELSQLISAMRTMKNMREMQQMMEMMQSLNPNAEKGDGKNEGFDALSALSALGGMGDMNNILANMDINELMQLLNNNNGAKD